MIDQPPSLDLRALADIAPTPTERLPLLFDAMVAIREFEERVLQLRLDGDVTGSVHLEIGQEAVAVGACSALGKDDLVYATYRGHGWALAAGAPFEALFAELLGRAAGVNGGRGGSAYLSHAASGFMGENSIVGAGAPIAVGAAMAAKHMGTNQVAATVFGDGATNQGSVHEALNLAVAFSLPTIFICENNGYSELTPIEAMVGEPLLHVRAASYGMRSELVDGNDPEAVHQAVDTAANNARAGGGPTFIEATTYRLCGHYIGDPETYRTVVEIENARQVEPLIRARELLAPTDPTLSQREQDVRARVNAAAEAALAVPLAPIETVQDYLYAY